MRVNRKRHRKLKNSAGYPTAKKLLSKTTGRRSRFSIEVSGGEDIDVYPWGDIYLSSGKEGGESCWCGERCVDEEERLARRQKDVLCVFVTLCEIFLCL